MAVDVVAPQPSQRRGIALFFPILGSQPRYNRSWLRPDIIAGITVVALLVPEGMAYAELAGMPPQSIFYAAPAALLLYAIFGTSRQLVVVVSSIQAVMSYSIVSALVPPETPEFIVLSAALAITAGTEAAKKGRRFGSPITNDVPHSVLNLYGTEGLSCGYDGGDRVAPDVYDDAFAFTGASKRVTLDLSGELIPDTEADLKIAMARQ